MTGPVRAALVGALLIGACAGPDPTASGRWQKSSADEGKVVADESYCRSWANAEAEREFRREGALHNEDIARPGSLDSMMGRHDARRRAQKLFEDCMRARGYARAP
jgi:hypothetical protein